jgi:hypothetical protein
MAMTAVHSRLYHSVKARRMSESAIACATECTLNVAEAMTFPMSRFERRGDVGP